MVKDEPRSTQDDKQVLEGKNPAEWRINLRGAMVNNMLKLGKYRHYKGNEYEVVGITRHSETLEELVLYRALYGNHDLWVRPLKMFTEEVVVEGKKMPRFEYVGK